MWRVRVDWRTVFRERSGVVRRHDDRPTSWRLLPHEEQDHRLHRLEPLHSGDLLRADGSDADVVFGIIDALYFACIVGGEVRSSEDAVDAFGARQPARTSCHYGSSG